MDFPTIRVQAALPGASPETMASSVALPLEKQFSAIAGLTSMNSTSTQGGTEITLQFDLSRQHRRGRAGRAVDDRPRVAAAAAAKCRRRRRIRRSTRPTTPSSSSSCARATLSLSALDELAQSNVAQRISMVSGVAQVNIFGSQKYAVRIDVDPRQLAARGLGIDELASAIQDANVNMPTGTIFGDRTFVVHDERPVDAGVGVRSGDHRLPQRLSRAARRGGARLRRRRERPHGELAERRALHLPVDSEAAGHERRADCRRDQGAAARHPGAAAGVGVARHPQRPLGRPSASRSTTSS